MHQGVIYFPIFLKQLKDGKITYSVVNERFQNSTDMIIQPGKQTAC